MSISSLSYYDSICLIAHYHNNLSGKRTTKSDLVNRGYSAEVISEITKKDIFNDFKTCGIIFKSDFSHLEYDQYSYVKSLYESYQLGILPFEGGSADQPAQIMQILTIINNLVNETKEQQRQQQEKANRVKSKRR